MRPPIYAICHKRFRTSGEGSLVWFKEAEEDKVFNLKFKTTRTIGHKRALKWFCGNHIEAAKRCNYLTWSKAKPLIRENK